MQKNHAQNLRTPPPGGGGQDFLFSDKAHGFCPSYYFKKKCICINSVADPDPDPVGSGLYGSTRSGSGSELFRTVSADPDPDPVKM